VVNVAETPSIDQQYGRHDLDDLYSELVAADECGDPRALARVAWSLYAQLGTVTADLTSLRAQRHSNPLGTAA
jgi:hypothetical protein